MASFAVWLRRRRSRIRGYQVEEDVRASFFFFFFFFFPLLHLAASLQQLTHGGGENMCTLGASGRSTQRLLVDRGSRRSGSDNHIVISIFLSLDDAVWRQHLERAKRKCDV